MSKAASLSSFIVAEVSTAGWESCSRRRFSAPFKFFARNAGAASVEEAVDVASKHQQHEVDDANALVWTNMFRCRHCRCYLIAL